MGKKKSPNWLRNRLEKSDIKSINLIVDITNYILLEQGQPLHAFDKDKLSKLIGKSASQNDFGIRDANDGETLQGLDGTDGFITAVFPAAKAGASFQDDINLAKKIF